MSTKTKKVAPEDQLTLRILKNIASGSRTAKSLKTALRKDVRRQIASLMDGGSIRKATADDYGKEPGDFILTRKGAGQLRFAS